MTVRRPLVLIAGRLQELPSADTLPGSSGSTAYAPGSFTVSTGNYSLMVKELQLTGSQRATLQGTSRLSVIN